MLNGKRILIENCPGIGDLIMVTPVLKRIKELYPQCILSVASYKGNLPVIKGLPYIDKTYGIEKGKILGHILAARDFYKQDYIVFTSWQPHLAAIAKVLGVKNRAGICKKKYSGKGLFHTELPNYEFDYKEYKADIITRQISLALGEDLSNDGVCEIASVSRQELAILLNKYGLKYKKYVVISPFAKTTRDLPIEIIKGVLEFFYKHRIKCVFINSQKSTWLTALAKQYGALDLCGETSIVEMVALLQGGMLNITVDSGPMHVSTALGVSTVSVFSTGNRYMWQPKKNCYPVTLDVSCAPCVREKAEKCNDKYCINNITFEMLSSQIVSAMRNLN